MTKEKSNFNFFTILSDILQKNSGGTLHENPEFEKIFSSYMLARYLSMRDSLVVYSMIVEKFQSKLTPIQIYKWMYKMVPRQNSGFIKYISKPKNKKGEKDSQEG
ncbi:MAG TPA: hypothetical protein PLA71_00990 [Saccharofermentans sp.]|nr:hypothetical protein [Saccharofermentans sp.]